MILTQVKIPNDRDATRALRENRDAHDDERRGAIPVCDARRKLAFRQTRYT